MHAGVSLQIYQRLLDVQPVSCALEMAPPLFPHTYIDVCVCVHLRWLLLSSVSHARTHARKQTNTHKSSTRASGRGHAHAHAHAHVHARAGAGADARARARARALTLSHTHTVGLFKHASSSSPHLCDAECAARLDTFRTSSCWLQIQSAAAPGLIHTALQVLLYTRI